MMIGAQCPFNVIHSSDLSKILSKYKIYSRKTSLPYINKNCLILTILWSSHTSFCLFLCLTSQSTAMVMSEQSVHLTTLFSWASLTSVLHAHSFAWN